MPMRAGLVYNPYQTPGASSGPGVAQIPEPPPLQVPQFQQPQTQQSSQRILYNPQTSQYLINNVLVDHNDAEYLQRAPEFLQEPIETDVPEGNWQPVNPDSLDQQIQRLSRLGVPELVASGTQAVGAGILRGTGLIGEQLGAPEVATDALRRAGDAVDMTEIQQGRMQAHMDNSSLLGKMLSAVPQGGPSFAASIGGAVAGGLVGGPVGAAAGGFATILPMMVDSAYQSAVQFHGEDYANSAEGRDEILRTGIATSVVQTFAPTMVASRALNMLALRAANQTVNNRGGAGRLATAGVIGATEAAAEASALLMEMVVFDPEARAMLDQGELEQLMPYLAQEYGEDTVIAAFAGGVLGGTSGLVVGGSRRSGVDANTNEPVDIANNVGQELAVQPARPGTTGSTTSPQFQASGPQGVLPLDTFSGRDIENLSRQVGGGRGVGVQPPVTPIGQERIDATERVGQGTLPFAIPESHRLAGPPDDSGPGMPPTDPVQQNLFDFGVPISPRADQTQQEVEQYPPNWWQTAPDLTPMGAQLREQMTEQQRLEAFDLLDQQARQQREDDFYAAHNQRLENEIDAAARREPEPQQGELFGRRDTPRMSRGEQMRRGLQPFPDTQGDPFVVPEEETAPRQENLFRQDGRPTAAGRRSAEPRQQTPLDAVPEPEPVSPMTANQFGTKAGKPFRNKGAASAQLGRIANDQRLSRDDLEIVEVEGGFAVQAKEGVGQAEVTVEDGVRRPSKLYRGFGMREYNRRLEGITPTRRGLFLTENREYAGGRYTRSTEGVGGVLETENVPNNPLNIDQLSAKTKKGEAARKKMRKQLEDFVKQSDDYTAENIEDSYLNDVLVEGENDFTQPTDLDVDFLQSLGYDSVYFSTEGPIGSGIETPGVNTWYVFENPFNDYVGEMRRALGIEPGEQTVAENRQKTGWDENAPPIEETRSPEEVAEEAAAQAVTPEDAWKALSLGVSWDALTKGPKGEQAKWAALVANNPEQTIETPNNQLVLDEVLNTAAREVNEAINDVQSYGFGESLGTLLDYAFNSQYNKPQVSKAARQMARNFVQEFLGKTNTHEAVFIDGVNAYLETFNSSYVGKFNNLVGDPLFDAVMAFESSKKAASDWFNAPRNENGTFPTKAELKAKNKANNAKDAAGQPTSDNPNSDKNNAATALASKLNQLTNQTDTKKKKSKINSDKKELKKLWENAIEQGYEDAASHVPGQPLSAFFMDGEPLLHPRTGRPVTQFISEDVGRQSEAQQREDARRAAEDEAAALDALAEQEGSVDDAFGGTSPGIRGWNPDGDYGDGNYFRADGKPITKPIETGRARMAVNKFLRGLRNKPKVGVYRNKADFRSKNPEGFREVMQGREDFATTPVAGVYYGDGNIAVFLDSIPTVQQLNVILAHETLGHFGFRALMPPKRLNNMLDQLHDRYDQIRAFVNEAIAGETGKDPDSLPADERLRLQREFTEEYMADMATVIDTNILARMWSNVKTFIEKLTGVQFDDHMARYFISQSRRYVRNGKVDASLLNWHDMGGKMVKAESGVDPHNKVMFSRGVTDGYAANRAAGTMKDVIGVPMSIADAGKTLRKAGINITGKFDTAVEKLFSLRTFRFRENRGAELVFDAVTKGKNTAMRVVNETNAIMRDALDRKAFDKLFGRIDSKEYKAANEMIYESMFYNINKFNAKTLGKTPLVYFHEGTGRVEVNTSEVNRLRKHGELTLEQFRKGITYKVNVQGAEEGTTVPDTRTVTARPGLTADSAEWKAYQSARNAVAHVWVEKIKADYQGFLQERDLNYRRIAERMDNDQLTNSDNQLLKRFSDKAFQIQEDGMTVDENTGAVEYSQEAATRMNDLIENVNRALLQIEAADKSQKAVDAVAAEFGGNADAIKSALQDMARRLNFNKGESVSDERFVVQNALKDIIMHELQTSQSERLAKQSLAQGYAPLKRRGRWQMRVIARNERGEVVKLDDNLHNMMSFRMFDDEADSVTTTSKVNETLFNEGGRPVVFENIRAYDPDQGGFRPMNITMEAVAEQAMTEQAGPSHLNLNEFMIGLRRFGIVLHPSKMNEVIVAMTKQNNSARNKLLREGKSGYDPDAIRAVSEFAESMGSNIAKTLMRPQISEYMDLNMRSSQKLWNGDKGYLQELKAKWERLRDDPNADPDAVMVAKRMYNKYAFQIAKTNPEGRASRANTYRNEAANLLAFLDGNASFRESDFESGPIVSRMRAYTSMFQLGGSIATGALNYIGAWMNGIPTLASYNEQRAFGGGFGLGKTVAEFTRAMNQVGLRSALLNSQLNDGDFYNEMLSIDPKLPNAKTHNARAEKLRNKYGLTEDEAAFIRDEINEGVMIPAQSNALLGTARGRMEKAAARKLVDGWMWTFNQTEQGSRRSLGLAAYRMELARQMAALSNKSDINQVREARERARRFAVETLDQTVGRYDVNNRPPVWRSGIASMAYMYKVFPTTSIQMLRNLSRNGKMGFLFGMWLLSGIRGFPFAEDIEDLIDTIAQGLGLQWRGTRIEMAEQVDKVFPGFSPTFVRGLLNQFSAGDVGIRTQLGNFVPGTGMFLAGANTSQELADIAGPMAGMLTALGETIPNAMRATTGVFTGDQRVSFNDVMRASPVTMMRALGDMLAYHDTGAIVDRRGYVIAPEVHAGHMLFRLGGWYPKDAANQYDIVRSAQRMANYQRETAASYRIAWIKAMMANDEAKARSIERSVDDWNRAARGTGLENRNFRANNFRALREARLPAVDRTMRTLPISARQDMEMTIDLLGYSD